MKSLLVNALLIGLIAMPFPARGQDVRHEPYRIVKEAQSKKGMVVTAHPLASRAGLKVLRKGGNAADAAVAAQLALAVVYPRAGNLGGGGFLVHRDADGKVITLDFREMAPANAHRDMYLDPTGEVIPDMSTRGAAAAGVPGSVAGLAETHAQLGRTTRWSTLVKPAIRLARRGFRLTADEADRLNRYRNDFIDNNPWPMPFIRESPWAVGDRLVQDELANTLKRIAREGKAGFYAGDNADALLRVMDTLNGLITAGDLEGYTPKWREPFRIAWQDYTLFTMGPPSSGGVILGQILAMLDDHLDDALGNGNAANIHLVVEAERRAFADRARYLGDADHYPVPMDTLLSASYILEKMKSFDPASATPSEAIAPGKVNVRRERFETTHLSVTDRYGNAAAVTTTLNDNFGCKVWVPGGGYFLNNEMDDFSVKPGVPNIYGLIGGEANAIAPHKRPLSSMSPTIVERNGRLWLVLGTPGGSTIPTSVLQVFLNAGPYGMTLYESVNAPRYHHQWLPDEIQCEAGVFTADSRATLEAMGHRIREVDRIGLIEAIGVDARGIMTGVADPRGDDHASGW
jgi:gamma-glutamyltranspeptidase/glutathione hydrolase